MLTQGKVVEGITRVSKKKISDLRKQRLSTEEKKGAGSLFIYPID